MTEPCHTRIIGWIRRDLFPPAYTERLNEMQFWKEEGAPVTPVVAFADYLTDTTPLSRGTVDLPPPSYMLPHLDHLGVELMPPTPLWAEAGVRAAIESAVCRVRSRIGTKKRCATHALLVLISLSVIINLPDALAAVMGGSK